VGSGGSGSSGNNTAAIRGFDITCRNPQGVLVASQTNTSSAAGTLAIPSLPVGSIYTCRVVALSNAGSSIPAVIRIAPQAIPLAVRGQTDFDGAGFAAVFVRGFTASTTAGTTADVSNKTAAPSAQVGRWDGSKLSFTSVADIGGDWSVLGTGDVAGAGKSALISRNSLGNVRVDLSVLPIPALTASATPAAAPAGIILRDAKLDWVVEAIGDLDGDGKADILWRYIKPGTNDSGVTFAWFMDGSETNVSVAEVKHRGGAPLNWNLVGVADLDGDNLGDIVWVSPTNQVRALIGKAGRTWVNQTVGQLTEGYAILKLGDIDGDGKADMLMRDANGNVKVWLMNGTTIKTALDLPTSDKRWQFYAAGDFDGDGTMDIAWVNANGDLIVWLINPQNVAAPAVYHDAGKAPAGLLPVEL